MSGRVPTVEQINKWYKEAVDQWIKEHASPEGVRKAVRELLDDRLEQIVKMALGFSKSSWGGHWEVDHCNGRAGESIVGDFLRKNAKEATLAWLQDLGAAKMTPLTKKELKHVRESYINNLVWMAKEASKVKAQEMAQKIVEEALSLAQEEEPIKKEIL